MHTQNKTPQYPTTYRENAHAEFTHPPYQPGDQTFIHAGYAPIFHAQYGKQSRRINSNPASFKPVGKKPVKGGRWAIRRLVRTDRNGKSWVAYNQGSMRSCRGRFETQAQAIQYVNDVLTITYNTDVKIGELPAIIRSATQSGKLHEMTLLALKEPIRTRSSNPSVKGPQTARTKLPVKRATPQRPSKTRRSIHELIQELESGIEDSGYESDNTV